MISYKRKGQFRGAWLVSLLVGIVRGNLSFFQAVPLILFRFFHIPHNLVVGELHFRNVDHTLWSLILEIIVERIYTPAGFRIHSEDVVVDIGAHRGVFSGFAARASNNTIYAYEPAIENQIELKRFVEDNHLVNVELHQQAVSSKTETVRLYGGNHSTRFSLTGKDQVTGEDFSDYIEVEAVSFEELILGIGYVDFIKIDCEGCEVGMLSSTSTDVLRRIDRMVIEFHEAVESPPGKTVLSTLGEAFSKVEVVVRAPQLGFIYCSRSPDSSGV